MPVHPFAHFFSSSTRDRGDLYVLQKRVRLLTVTPVAIEAAVRGTEPYVVRLLLRPASSGRGEELLVSCTCPYFYDGPGTCKHQWAAIAAARTAPGSFIPGLEAQRKGFVLVTPDEGDLDDEFEDELDKAGDRRGPAPMSPGQVLLAHVAMALASDTEPVPRPSRIGEELLYVIDLDATTRTGGLQIEILSRSPKKSGGWKAPKAAGLRPADVRQLPPAEAEIVAMLAGGMQTAGAYGDYALPAVYTVPGALARVVIPRIAATGHAHVRCRRVAADLLPVAWDDAPPWRFEIVAEPTGTGLAIAGRFTREGSRLPRADLLMTFDSGFVITRTTIARAELPASRPLFAALVGTDGVTLSDDETASLAEVLAASGTGTADLPEALRTPEVDVDPVPKLTVGAGTGWRGPDELTATVTFDYDGLAVPADHRATAWDRAGRRVIRRRPDTERAAVALLAGLPVSPRFTGERGPVWALKRAALSPVVRTLVEAGWRVEAEGRAILRPSRVSMRVTSGIDWFDLDATVEFPTGTAPLTDVLAALKAGSQAVTLGDGSMGLLPETWLERYAPIAAMGQVEGTRVRFRLPQAALLDALLAAQADQTAITIDERFAGARAAVARFDRVAPADPPPSFQGMLRPYQREGLGWMGFLRDFGFGGCLADDMGLGKTIMVLALLEARRRRDAADAPRPSLVVAPRSVVSNWIAEAARFTPELRVRDISHADRRRQGVDWGAIDLAIASYGTLRRDIGTLKDQRFDYAILDEAQAIKNAGTASAKAARLLTADHRLALSGTPIENHLGELWSLVEFLNPGLLGRSNVFGGASSARRTVDAETADLLSRALRPFILRRTKAQVATDLPERTEQTIVCELEGKQRSFYDALRTHYQRALLDTVDRVGLGRSKIQVLEALLRLRQAACHPRLIDKAMGEAPCAKLDVLVPRLAEVVAEGHKALVFSQFTSFLAIVRDALDREGVAYEYLDGRTRDRQSRVDRFQTDPACRAFLISLKAGGLGLNLTAAEYVFLLDPWWNPAVEAQAIDRAHRIGQTQHVFAYRLIARDTVEEKVLQLQETKRSLADAILRADAGLVGQLQREDLELLLS